MWAREPKDASGNRGGLQESTRWTEGYNRITELAARLPDTRLVYVTDREADIVALMAQARDLGSGLPVSMASLTPAICGVSGNTVTLLQVGLCTLEAAQPGDSQYSTAPSVMQTFSVASASESGNDGDVPMPPWALLLLGAGLLAAMRRRLA